MAEVKKSDFIYFQNEFLQDIKKIDIKFTEQIAQIIKTFQNHKLITDQKFEIVNEKISSLLTTIETNTEIKKLNSEIENFKKILNQELLTNSNKIIYLERDLSDACFKYDSLFSSIVGAPGLIGKGCKYSDMKAFYELTDKKIAELENYKNKKNIDLDKYKNKLETLIGQFKLQINSSQNKYFSFCNEKILEAKNKIDEQFNFIDEKINNMRMDNGKHTFDLIKSTDELKQNINTINNITNEVDKKLKEEMAKYQKQNHDLLKTFELQREEFKIIKIRFTELSEFIKDIRFMRNINNYSKGNNNNKENKDFDSAEFSKKSKILSKKINFDKPQKINEIDVKKFINNYKEIKRNKIIEDNNNINNDKNANCNDDDNNNNIGDNKKENNNKDKLNNEEKKKYNIKFNIKDKGSNTNINFNSTYNNNLNITKNNNIINNNYTINSSEKTISINSIKTPNYSRNYKKLYNEGIKINYNSNKKLDYLKTEESLFNTINQNKQKNLFVRTQSQFCLNNEIQKPELKSKLQKTQENFYHKKPFKINKLNNNNNNNILNNRGLSSDEIRKFKKIVENEEKIDFKELLKVLENNNINNNLIHIEAYKFLNNNISNIEERINKLNNMTKFNFDKIYKKIQIYLDLTNTLLIKMKKEKSKSVKKKELNSPIKIYTASEINIPFINSFDKNNPKNNNNLTERKKIKNIDNALFNINIKDKHQTISSGKILSVIEPYLIKKFKNN